MRAKFSWMRSSRAVNATFGSAVSGSACGDASPARTIYRRCRRVSRCFQSRLLQAQRTDVDPIQAAELHSCGERIKPIQPREPREIPICRAQRESMLDGERREMRIRHEITIHARQCQKLAKYCGVTL
jgi:hypothetical protein